MVRRQIGPFHGGDSSEWIFCGVTLYQETESFLIEVSPQNFCIMKRSLFIALLLSVIATGSLYANDASIANVNRASALVEFAANVILDHGPYHYYHPKDCCHHPHKPHRVKRHDDCCHHHHHCCPPPAPRPGKGKHFDAPHRPKGGHNVAKPHKPGGNRKGDYKGGKRGGERRDNSGGGRR